MDVNGSHRGLQQQQQQPPNQPPRISNGNGRDHWSKLPEPQNGHEPQVSKYARKLTGNCGLLDGIKSFHVQF